MSTRRTVSVMGSTGSIGCSALDVIRAANRDGRDAFELVALAAGNNVEMLAEQALEFRPQVAVVSDEAKLPVLRDLLAGSGIEAAAGRTAVTEAATRPAGRVLAAIVGAAGLESTLAAVRAGNDVAIANKESVVCGGRLILEEAEKTGARVLPVDSEHSALAQALRGAIERDELRLAFQPQVTTSDQRICGFEALLRWHHAEYGDVSPSEFVPIAESAGLMHAIGDWVLHKACEEAALWREDINVSINISAAQLTAPDFVARVQSAASGIASGRVELEVTESVLIDDGDTAVASLRRLRALGFRTALDDFGTGYSALGYLRQFPFDTLKIDRSFVRDLYTDHEAQVLVETIVAMARALGMATVAEGVEDVRQASMLAEHGCDCLQGYLISRPMPAHAVAAFIHDWQGIDEIAPVQASLQAPLGIA